MDEDRTNLLALLTSYNLPSTACAAFSGDIKCRNRALSGELLCAKHCLFGEEPRLPPMLHGGRIVEELIFYTPRNCIIPGQASPKRMTMQRCCAVVQTDFNDRPSERCLNIGLCWPYCPTHMVREKRILMNYNTNASTYIGLYAMSVEAPENAVIFGVKQELATTVERGVLFPDACAQQTSQIGRYDLHCADTNYPFAYLQQLFSKRPLPFTFNSTNYVCDMTFRRANLMFALTTSASPNATIALNDDGVASLTSTALIRNGQAICVPVANADVIVYMPRFPDYGNSFYNLPGNGVRAIKALYDVHGSLRMATLSYRPVVRLGQPWVAMLVEALASTKAFNMIAFFQEAWRVHGERLRDAWKLFMARFHTVHVLAVRARSVPGNIPGRVVFKRKAELMAHDLDDLETLGREPTSQLYLTFMVLVSVLSCGMSMDAAMVSTTTIVSSISTMFHRDGSWSTFDNVRGHAITSILLQNRAEFTITVDKQERVIELKKVLFDLQQDAVFQHLRNQKRDGKLTPLMLATKHELLYNAMVNACNETLVHWNNNRLEMPSIDTLHEIEQKYATYMLSIL
jgi:hypothetical protein